MEQDKKRKREPVYSLRLRAGKRRTYFFDVRPTKSNDFYLTITESKKRYDDEGYERHKLFLYKEDFNKFMNALELTFDHVKSQLMPDYDFDEFTREIKDDNIQENPEAIPDELDVPASREVEKKKEEGEDTSSEDAGTDEESQEEEKEEESFEVSFDTDLGTADEDASEEVEAGDAAGQNEEESKEPESSAAEEEEKDEDEDEDEKEDSKKKDDNNEDAEKW